MGFIVNNFEEVKKRSVESYFKIGHVRCPYFHDDVLLGVEGITHLSFKNYGRPRQKEDQYVRCRLLYLVPKILERSHLVQDIRKVGRFERVRAHNRTDVVHKQVTYYEFIALLEGKRIKVIVKQIENGERFFWSVIPFWKAKKGSKK